MTSTMWHLTLDTLHGAAVERPSDDRVGFAASALHFSGALGRPCGASAFSSHDLGVRLLALSPGFGAFGVVDTIRREVVTTNAVYWTSAPAALAGELEALRFMFASSGIAGPGEPDGEHSPGMFTRIEAGAGALTSYALLSLAGIEHACAWALVEG